MERIFEEAKDILKTMQTRYSLRSFDRKPIPEDVLQEIIKTGLTAASGGNLQPCSIIVVKDEERKKRLAEICSDQAFIREAPVNLVFLLDWNRYAVYAEEKKAPFVANRTANHFLIAMEDVMCMAQTIETAAYLCGIGSCYVGSTIGQWEQLSELLKLPQKTYPVVMLSMGYPKKEITARRPKLSYDMMVFDETYPDLTREQIVNAFEEKNLGRMVKLPAAQPFRSNALARLRESLLTTYTKEETDVIMREAEENGAVNETQRRFGLHYEASWMEQHSEELMNELKKAGVL